MKDILGAAAPYGMIKDAESLIQIVEGVNTALVTKRSDHVLQRIDAHKAADLASKGFLETQADIDDYLKRLRQELESAINNKQRVEIR